MAWRRCSAICARPGWLVGRVLSVTHGCTWGDVVRLPYLLCPVQYWILHEDARYHSSHTHGWRCRCGQCGKGYRLQKHLHKCSAIKWCSIASKINVTPVWLYISGECPHGRSASAGQPGIKRVWAFFTDIQYDRCNTFWRQKYISLVRTGQFGHLLLYQATYYVIAWCSITWCRVNGTCLNAWPPALFSICCHYMTAVYCCVLMYLRVGRIPLWHLSFILRSTCELQNMWYVNPINWNSTMADFQQRNGVNSQQIQYILTQRRMFQDLPTSYWHENVVHKNAEYHL